ncbi:MAG TPA: TonB-dependent receptor [Puia sp.]|nr:TonB-dependent receptor [Puia sp.]
MRCNLIVLLTLLFTSLLHAKDAGSQSLLEKKITLTVKNQLLKDALNKITEMDGVNIIFTGNSLFNTERVSIDVKSVSLKKVLNELLAPYPLTYKVVDDYVVIKRTAANPETNTPLNGFVDPRDTLKGRVTDPVGNALPGVSVTVIGKPFGAATNDVGAYSIPVSPDDSIRFSFVGYKTLVRSVRNKDELNVQMEADSTGLNDVVVTGYGQVQKSISVTGAISTVRTKELKQSPVANLSNALAGRLPGLTAIQSSGLPGSDAAAIYIRGVGTYGANKSPLIVIDGLPRGDANFGDIDVNEVASVSILKDAASTSLYGVQGANGVVLITTKRGKTSGKPNIEFNGQYSQQRPTRLPTYLDAYHTALLINEGRTNEGSSPIYTNQQLQIIQSKSDPYTYPDVDWYSVILKPSAPQQRYNINISGGNDIGTYFVSGSYLHQGSLLKAADNNKYGVSDKYDRYNLRSNINLNVSKMLSLRLDLATRLENRTGPGAGVDQGVAAYDWIFKMLSQYSRTTSPVYNPDGSYAFGTGMPPDWRNILAEIQSTGYYNNFWHSTNGTVEATHLLDVITPGLKIKGLVTFENYGTIDYAQSQHYDSYRYSKDPVTGTETYAQMTTANSLTKTYSTSGYRYYFYDVQLNYDRRFGRHNISGMFLGNRSYTSVYNDLPHVYQGLVGNASYNYDQRYYLQFNFGYNGSENFPPGKRYGFFPAVSAGWIISDEEFFKNNIRLMNFLKLRGSYGIVGNDQISTSRWLFLSNYSPITAANGYTFGNPGTNVAGYYESSVGNENVTWERAKKADIAIETGFFKNAVKLTVDYFHERRDNILTTPRTIPDYLGVSVIQPKNVGSVVNRGIEIDLNVNTHVGKVNLFGNINYSLAKNKILYADEPQLAYAYQYAKGRPIGDSLGYIADGIYRSQAEIDKGPKSTLTAKSLPGDIRYKDMNGDGVIDAKDRAMIANYNFPTQTFGGSIGFAVYNFDFSILFQGALGGVANYQGYLIPQYQYRPYQWNNRWTAQTAQTARYPSMHYNDWTNDNVNSTFWQYKTDYIKLRNFEVGYSLTGKLLQRVKIKKFRVFINAQNLVTWDKLPFNDVDPEINPSGNTAVPYPINKVYNAGVTVNL